MQEKSRYTADRIARTEMARAWADGFLADIMQDDDVVAVKWKLSSRHPVFDVCDMYSKANMYNLGSGIYPKSKIPTHCLCWGSRPEEAKGLYQGGRREMAC